MAASSDLFCGACNKTFQKHSALTSHQKSKAHLAKIGQDLDDTNSKVCTKCNQRYINTGYDKHFQHCQNEAREICGVCGRRFSSIRGLNQHKLRDHNSNPNQVVVEEEEDELGIDAINYQENIGASLTSIELFFQEYSEEIKNSIITALERFRFIKYSTKLHLTFSRKGDMINPFNVQIKTKYRIIFLELKIMKLNQFKKN